MIPLNVPLPEVVVFTGATRGAAVTVGFYVSLPPNYLLQPTLRPDGSGMTWKLTKRDDAETAAASSTSGGGERCVAWIDLNGLVFLVTMKLPREGQSVSICVADFDYLRFFN